MKSSRIVTLGLIAAMLMSTCVVSGWAGEQYVEGKVYSHTLDNGMTVLTVERHL